jgi:hypothetical protein
MTLYPNPCGDVFQVFSNENIIQMNIIDLNGMVITNICANDRQLTIPIRNFLPGIYTVQLKTAHQSIRKMLVKD